MLQCYNRRRGRDYVVFSILLRSFAYFRLVVNSLSSLRIMILLANRRFRLRVPALLLVCLLFAALCSGSTPDTANIDQGIARVRVLKQEDPEGALKLCDSLMQMARELKNAKRISMCYISFGTIYDDIGAYEKAFSSYDSALAITKANNFRKGTANIYNNKALIYSKTGKLEQALSNHLEALRIRKELNDTVGVTSSTGNLGLTYHKLKQFKKSIECIEECIRAKQARNESEANLARWYNGLAVSYDDDGQEMKARQYYEKAIAASEAADDQQNLGFAYGNLGSNYMDNEDYPMALHYMMKAYKLLKTTDEPDALALNTAGVASLLNELGRYKEAVGYGQESLRLSTDLHSFDCMYNAHRALGQSYALLGNGKLADSHYQSALRVKDSMYNKDIADATTAMEAKYKNEIKEAQIKTLKKDNEVRQLTIDAAQASLTTTRSIAALLTLALVAIAIVFFVTVSRLKIKQQLRLAEEREQQQKAGIAAVIQAQEEERQRIARELHDSVCQQLGAIRIGLQHPATTAAPALKHLDAITTEVRGIAYQMLPVTLQQYGLSPALSELIQHTFSNSAIEARFEDLGAQTAVNGDVKLTMYRVAQELVSNVVKHSAAARVNMQLLSSKENLVLIVEDDGRGIAENKTGGMGLLNIRTRIQQVDGSMTMENNTGHGLRTIVKIPLAA